MLRRRKKPWRLLGLKYPTSPVDNPHFQEWLALVNEWLEPEEALIDFGFANELEMLHVDPGSGSGEGFFAVTNRRSLFSYELAPAEGSGQPFMLEILHSMTERCASERGWADPGSGEVFLESDAPDRTALRRIRRLGYPEMAVVHISWKEGDDRKRRARFLTGPSAGANWPSLVARFREDARLPKGWEPNRLFPR